MVRADSAARAHGGLAGLGDERLLPTLDWEALVPPPLVPRQPGERIQFVYLALADWEGSRQRPQHIAAELSRAHRVLYVRPVPFTRWVRDRGQVPLRPEVETISESLVVVRPRLLSPGRLGSVARWNARVVASRVRRLQDPALPTVLWLSHPNQSNQLGVYGEQLACFDWMDYHAAFKDGLDRDQIEAEELGLLRRANVVFASSADLMARAGRLGVEAVRVANAADPEFFALAATKPLPCPAEIAALPRPRLLFYGTFGPWVDTTFLRALALTRRDWPFILIGARTEETKHALRDLPNVHWLGWRQYEDLPPYLQHADVCLLPFRTGSLTRAVDPVKLYEYLGAGKPVIATPLDEYAKCGDLVDIVTSAEQAASVIERRLAEPETEEWRLRRLRFAAANTWRHRATTVLSAIESRIGNQARSARDAPTGPLAHARGTDR